MSKDEKERQVQEEQQPEVQQELSKVAANPKQSFLILGIVVAILIYLFFTFFIASKDDTKKKDPVISPKEVVKPNVDKAEFDTPKIPELPTVPKLIEPINTDKTPELAKKPETIPELPKTEKQALPPANTSSQAQFPMPNQQTNSKGSDFPTLPFTNSSANSQASDDAQKRKDTKRKSAIVLIAGSPDKKTPEQAEQEASFTKRGDMEFVLGRGKLIDAVLESSINTDFGGEVRAVVSRDVFSQNGKIILIPKGSRIFGSYGTDVSGAYGRISIAWTRIDLASGYSINLDSKAVDNLGRQGIHGRVDTKLKETFSNAILLSAFNIAFANVLDKVVAPPASSQAATANTAAATQVNNTALAIYSDTTKTPAQKYTQICAAVIAAVPDKTATGYTAFVTACTTPPTGTPEQQLATIMTAVSTLGTSLAQASATATTPSQAQDASKQAFTDVSSALKDVISSQKLQPTITINQGTLIKVYVNKDYKFPKDVLMKNRLMK